MERACRPPAFRAPRIPFGARRVRLRRRAQRLAAAVPAPAPLRCARRGDAHVRQVPFLRRVRVRLGVGRRPRAARRSVLPQARRRRPVYAGPRPQGPRRRRGRAAPRSSSPARALRCTSSSRWRTRPGSCTSAACSCGARCSSTGGTTATATSGTSCRAPGPRGARTSGRSGGGGRLRGLAAGAIERRRWEFFNRCYRSTYAAHRSSPYLNLEFFVRIGARLPESLAMVLAERAGRPIASALFLRDAATLYGRYWGAIEHVPLLHFECCYYQPIEFAIGRGLEVFEGGAQGEHKLFRGLMPVETLSAHWLAHARFSRAVEAFLEREGAGVQRYVDELCDHSPFKA